MARPSLKPTEDQRRLVKSMAAMGTPHEGIARKIGCSAKTLRLRFRDELDSGVTEANYMVAQTLYKMATSGDCVAATIFWTKTRNQFRERDGNDARQIAPPPFLIGCEETPPQQENEQREMTETTDNDEEEGNND
jgi:hypothetical protein